LPFEFALQRADGEGHAIVARLPALTCRIRHGYS
jgi:hypothetical protein